jgi:hypothetical protein
VAERCEGEETVKMKVKVKENEEKILSYPT